MKKEQTAQPKKETVKVLKVNESFQKLRDENKTEKLYRENKLVFPVKDFDQLHQKKGLESHIFDTDGPQEKTMPTRKIYPIKDSVLFNDEYVEKNNNFHFQKRHILPEKLREENKIRKECKYSDEIHGNPQKDKNLNRRIQENYGSNPIEILNDEQNNQMMQNYQKSVRNKTTAVANYLGSNGVKRTFKNFRKEPASTDNSVDKITNVPSTQLQVALERKKEEPSYSKKGFKKLIVGANRVDYA